MFKKTIIISCLALCSLGIFGSPAQAAEPETLSPRNAGIATMAAFTAQGDLDSLRPAINQALDSGLTVNEACSTSMPTAAFPAV